MSTAAIHAIIVGIDQYPDYPPLSNSVRDTRRMSDILIKLGADKKNITLLTDSRATKDGILQELQSLPARVKRNDPIVFFFSGYAASATSDQSEEQPSSRVGVLCPYDISKNGGISDKALLQAFDLLSQSCGNNITVLLDCGGDCFGWDMPVSCVVVFPNKATEDEKGGIFTSAIISVLDGQVGQFQSITMTVEAFSKRIESIAVRDDAETVVHCIGVNVDRPLFNSEAPKAHYALIPGYTSKDGKIIIRVGAAHDVHIGDMYMIFGRNIIVEDDFDRLPGKLCVVSLEPDDVTSVVSLVGESGNEAPRNVPPFFYVVEEHCDASNLHINAIGEANQILDNISGWVKGSEESANITLMKQRDNVRFMWNGLSTDRKLRRRNWDATIDSGASLASLQRHVRRAARFNRYLAAPSPLNSPVLEKLRFLLHKIDTDKEKWARTGENMLEGRYSVDLTLSEKEKIKGPYCLTICNDNGFAVWPYVFMCDPEGFVILPWYAPPRGALTPPLASKEELTIGLEDNADDLLFQYRKNQDYDVLYLKIFVTKEKTDFSFIRQWFAAKNEEKLRDYSSSTVHSHDHRLEAQSHIDSTFTEESSPIKTKPKIAGWASVCATILVTYETKGKGESKLEVLGVDEEARSSQDTASVNKDGKEKEGSTLEEAYVTQEVNDSNQSSAPQQKDHKTKKRESGIQKLWSKLANR